MPSPLYKLRDYKETDRFELEHPVPLRWKPSYKQYVLTESEANTQGIWLKEKNELVAEIIFSWQSKNVLHIDSITVLPKHRGNGFGYDLIKLLIEWALTSEYYIITGEARQGASWHLFKNFGAEEILIYEDWHGTKENYVSFKMHL
jgi:GNAT superfamily N-acetyltransferase